MLNTNFLEECKFDSYWTEFCFLLKIEDLLLTDELISNEESSVSINLVDIKEMEKISFGFMKIVTVLIAILVLVQVCMK